MEFRPRPPAARATLGELLRGSLAAEPVAERSWARLVSDIAGGDQRALHALYERSHRAVFTLLLRLTSNRRAAETLTLDVYQAAYREAQRYRPADGTVMAWIMNLARERALSQLHGAQAPARAEEGLLSIDTPDYRDLMELKALGRALRTALEALSAEERAAIEAAFFEGQAPAAARRTLRAGLHKLCYPASGNPCEHGALACAQLLRALPPREAAAAEAHIAKCWRCRRELDTLRPVLETFVAWPTDLLRPVAPLEARLAQRLAAHTGGIEVAPPRAQWVEPPWEAVAAGLSCKLLALDTEREIASLLVRLAPGGEYPPHRHAGVEELHLLEGELWIDERKLVAGDYNRAEPGSSDRRVWSETGCACVLVTSARDELV